MPAIKTGQANQALTGPKIYLIITNYPKSVSPVIEVYKERSLARDNLPIEARKLKLFDRVDSDCWRDPDSGYWIRIEARPVRTYETPKIKASELSSGIVRG